MKLISFLLRYTRGTMFVTVLVGIASGLCSVALVAMITSRLSLGGSQGEMSLAKYAALVFAVLVTNLVSRSLLTHISQSAILDMRMNLCRKVLGAPLRHLEETGAHRVMGALTDDIATIANALLDVPNFCINFTITLGCVIYLGWLAAWLFPALVCFLVLVVISVKLLQRRAMKDVKAAREDWDTLVGCFNALTDGAKEMKMHHARREAFLSEVLQPAADDYRKHSVKGRRLQGVTASWVQVLYFIFIGVALLMLPGSGGGQGHILVGYTLTLLYMRAPMSVVMDIIPSFMRANLAMTKVEQLGVKLTAGGSEQWWATRHGASPQLEWTKLELDGVTHAYRREREERDFVLGPLNLSFEPGELVFIAGGNGSGKTTLAKLLTGLYAPEGGEIRMNGVPVTDRNRDFFRQHFSVVFSVPYLFKKLLGLTRVDLDERARGYIRQLHLDHKIEVRDGRLSTTNLSQGQRKRLALLTAYLEDRPIYVFDEWAADQDPVFKEIFYLELLFELKARGKTVVVISHDDRYYHLADRIIKLENGHIQSEEIPGAPDTTPERFAELQLN